MSNADASSADAASHGPHVLTVCNACRYCEQFCPVFPAVERRLTFGTTDLAYLANLCHNCGECLSACQYAPPHEFGINVPRTLAEIRLTSYEGYAWPRPLGVLFGAHNLLTGLGLATAMSALLFGGTWLANPGGAAGLVAAGDFYAVIPHGVMVALFGGVSLFVLVALAIGVSRFWRDISRTDPPHAAASRLAAVGDVLTLRHLHPKGVDCVSGEERHTPWRRWYHHFTFYGFLLCCASTSVAAVYHEVLGRLAPYAYTSLPVLLGTAGGAALIVGTGGLFVLRGTRDSALGDPRQDGLSESFLALLFLTALTGLALLGLRQGPLMVPLLLVHLGTVLALLVTLPYGKFVHGLYRAAALLKSAAETSRDT